jgi:uncharacterized protein YggU (UPF0235/DUF167 family)
MYIKVKVTPSSKKEKFLQKNKDTFIISVCEEAQMNLANKRVSQIIADHFNISFKDVKIINGHHSRSKILSVNL